MSQQRKPSSLVERNHERAEAGSLALRMQMMAAINSILDKEDWRQQDISLYLQITQPRVSNLRNGQVEKFSTEALVKFLMVLGYEFNFAHVPAEGNNADRIKITVSKIKQS